MNKPSSLAILAFSDHSIEKTITFEGPVAAFYVIRDTVPTPVFASDALEKTTSGQVSRALKGAGKKCGDAITILAPSGMRASALILVCLGVEGADINKTQWRKIGGAIAKALNGAALGDAEHAHCEVRIDKLPDEAAHEIALALQLKSYRFERRKSTSKGPRLTSAIIAPTPSPESFDPTIALAAGVSLTRDLVNEPANALTTDAFADEVRALAKSGLAIEILDQNALKEMKMGALLAVGQGSVRPSYIAVMRWNGADDPTAPPVCLVGKGVVFDTGGISLKPASGMEEMTTDMGGAAVVVGAMQALALRKAKANIVGLIGIVENMPDGDAMRPGDIVTAMSGKTIEVINTDAEGRLVLADVLWYAQETYKPRWIVNLATLTGAMIIALGHENAGFFANDDDLAQALTDAARREGEGIWRLPLGDGYDKLLKSRLADMKNTGGRSAGSITAAQFLQRFIKPGQSWAHIDIAGVTLMKEEGPTWPKGASGWGVATLTRLIEDAFR